MHMCTKDHMHIDIVQICIGMDMHNFAINSQLINKPNYIQAGTVRVNHVDYIS